MATPTKDEIERGAGIADNYFTGGIANRCLARAISEALADTREREMERCAEVADRVSKVTGTPNDALDRNVIQPTWKAAAETIASAIRKGA